MSEEGLIDGFIDAITVTQPQNTGGHTYEEFCRIQRQYSCSLLIYPVPDYCIAYVTGFDLGSLYLTWQYKQFNHNWYDVTSINSDYEEEICVNPKCQCKLMRRRLRKRNQSWDEMKSTNTGEWEYFNH